MGIRISLIAYLPAIEFSQPKLYCFIISVCLISLGIIIFARRMKTNISLPLAMRQYHFFCNGRKNAQLYFDNPSVHRIVERIKFIVAKLIGFMDKSLLEESENVP